MYLRSPPKRSESLSRILQNPPRDGTQYTYTLTLEGVLYLYRDAYVQAAAYCKVVEGKENEAFRPGQIWLYHSYAVPQVTFIRLYNTFELK